MRNGTGTGEENSTGSDSKRDIRRVFSLINISSFDKISVYRVLAAEKTL